jgi:N6-L-threonylcarbamoyladenine synthase
MIVLGIESSCDETAAGVVGPGGLLSDLTFTQDVHVVYGGVVPELASRAHAERILATVKGALAQAGVEVPDAIAATAGPGLIGALLVGFSFGKAAAFAWGRPFVGVNHLEAHLLSPTLPVPDGAGRGGLEFPYLALVVSGGHTTLYAARDVARYEILGSTVDDAAGEAYDKVARLMGLGYPGGPLLDRLARDGDPGAVPLPRPRAGGLDMSFSGLKTAVRSWIEKHPTTPAADLAASFQAAVIDVLVDRLQRAVQLTGLERVAVSGGVAANAGLRARLATLPFEVVIPPIRYCTDNGAMVAHAGRQRLLRGLSDELDMRARPVWPLGTH